MNNIKISYIIPYKHNNERFLNLKKVLLWLKTLRIDIRITIVEQLKSKESFTLKDILSDVNIISVFNNKNFNKSWLMNIGSKYNDCDVLIFGDCDMIMNNNDFLEAIKKISNNHVVSPYNRVIDLDYNNSLKNFSEIFKIGGVGRGENDNQKINLCGGITLFRKDALLNIGGWSEEFEEWGCEDDYQTYKVNIFNLKYVECDFNSYHLYHNRNTINMEVYKRNFNILDTYTKMDINKHLNYIKSTFNKIGLLNKYSK